MILFKPNFRIFILLIIFITKGLILAQGTLEDYERADKFRDEASKLVYHTVEEATWIGKSNRFWYRSNKPEGKRFILVDVKKKSKKPAFNHQRLAKALSQLLGKKVTDRELPFDYIEFKEKGTIIEFLIESHLWTCHLKTYQCKKGKKVDPQVIRRQRYRRRRWGRPPQKKDQPGVSPDQEWEAFIKDFNVFLRSTKDKKEFQLSFDGTEGHHYDDSFLWSPDSKKLVTNRVLPGYERLVHYIESSPDDQLQPKHNTNRYPKPGDPVTIRKPSLFDVDQKGQIPVVDTLFKNPYYIRQVKWRKDSRAFTFEYNQRGHQVYRIIEVKADNGTVRTLVDEKANTFYCYYSKHFRFDVDDGSEIIWMSERDGWNHLFLYDGNTGKVKNQITKGTWVVRRVLHVNEKERQILFLASGKEPNIDPYLLHCYRINFNGKGLIRLTTQGNTNHQINLSESKEFYIDTYSRINLSPVTVVCRAKDGKKVMELEETDISALLKTGWRLPEVFSSYGRDDKTTIWGIICRPSTFNPQKKYRVIEYIYAGPHNSFVPKSFRPNLFFQPLAELGFIVVQIDGMGTSNRSKAFHDICWKNLKDAGFPDRIRWHQAVAKKYDHYSIDSGVGIYGHSAGGQSSTGALLFHPDFYSVAVSSCGCHDNRMDKISWNEQWMGYPVGPHYAESSNSVNAHKLKGHLFLIVTELDTNVDPASTLQVADRLIKAQKNFDFLLIPGLNHGIRGDIGKYVERRRRDFFVKHLLGIDPPPWNSIKPDKK
jgi:dipeptidyl aminopeptidase/acylaminoacyl peptidase